MTDAVEGHAARQEARVAGSMKQPHKPLEKCSRFVLGTSVGRQFVAQQRAGQDLRGAERAIFHARPPTGGIGIFPGDLIWRR